MERIDGKAAGDHGFITCQRISLADGARADAIPNAAGGDGGDGAAKPGSRSSQVLRNATLSKVQFAHFSRSFWTTEGKGVS
jgi:hypothetical protein